MNILKLKNQKKQTSFSHGVRFDVFIKDSKRIFDIEMQTTDTKDLLERSLYYQSMIAVKNLKKGKKYSAMKESFVIFICTFDLFKMNSYKYTIKSFCKEIPNLKINDKSTRIFYNVNAFEDCKDEDLRAFLRYVSTNKSSSDFTKKIEETVDFYKENEDWRCDYMTFGMKLAESKYEGIEIGRKDSKIETAKIALNKGFSLDIIQELTGLSKAQISSLQKNKK